LVEVRAVHFSSIFRKEINIIHNSVLPENKLITLIKLLLKMSEIWKVNLKKRISIHSTN